MCRAVWMGVAALLLWVPGSRAAPVCVFGSAPCWLACHNPPAVDTPRDAALILQGHQYRSIDRLDQVSALLLTQFGKCIGIQGWKRYHFEVWATGTVYQAATSWDGLRTVDIALDNFDGSTDASVLDQPRYIRAEIIRGVWKHLQHKVEPGNRICVRGELHWDGDGFLEIHPAHNGDVTYLLPSAPLCH